MEAAGRFEWDSVRIATTEIRDWLDRLELDTELRKALSKMVLEVKAEVRFRPAEGGRPYDIGVDTKASIHVRKTGKDALAHGKEGVQKRPLSRTLCPGRIGERRPPETRGGSSASSRTGSPGGPSASAAATHSAADDDSPSPAGRSLSIRTRRRVRRARAQPATACTYGPPCSRRHGSARHARLPGSIANASARPPL